MSSDATGTRPSTRECGTTPDVPADLRGPLAETADADSRVRRVFLTDEGRTEFGRAWPAMHDAFEAMFDGVDDAEYAALIATLLMDLLRRSLPGVTVKRYRFRALKPLYDTANFFTCGVPDDSSRSARLWTRDAEGDLTMEATAEW